MFSSLSFIPSYQSCLQLWLIFQLNSEGIFVRKKDHTAHISGAKSHQNLEMITTICECKFSRTLSSRFHNEDPA